MEENNCEQSDSRQEFYEYRTISWHFEPISWISINCFTKHFLLRKLLELTCLRIMFHFTVIMKFISFDESKNFLLNSKELFFLPQKKKSNDDIHFEKSISISFESSQTDPSKKSCVGFMFPLAHFSRELSEKKNCFTTQFDFIREASETHIFNKSILVTLHSPSTTHSNKSFKWKE